MVDARGKLFDEKDAAADICLGDEITRAGHRFVQYKITIPKGRHNNIDRKGAALVMDMLVDGQCI